jgi:hypothetical protein
LEDNLLWRSGKGEKMSQPSYEAGNQSGKPIGAPRDGPTPEVDATAVAFNMGDDLTPGTETILFVEDEEFNPHGKDGGDTIQRRQRSRLQGRRGAVKKSRTLAN